MLWSLLITSIVIGAIVGGIAGAAKRKKCEETNKDIDRVVIVHSAGNKTTFDVYYNKNINAVVRETVPVRSWRYEQLIKYV